MAHYGDSLFYYAGFATGAGLFCCTPVATGAGLLWYTSLQSNKSSICCSVIIGLVAGILLTIAQDYIPYAHPIAFRQQ